MYTRILSLLLLLVVFKVNAQEKGIHFQHGLSWKEIKAKAKQENKFIFVDCYTTWCGPCKWMSREIFPQEVVGNYFNEKFISVKAQMDKTDKDDESVKQWYADADAIATDYKIMAYPTFLYFTPAGELVHIKVGTDSAAAFIAASAKALQPETQYYTRMAAALKNAGKDTALLRGLATEAHRNYDGQYADIFFTRYLQVLPTVFNKETIQLMDEFTRKSGDTGFVIFKNNKAKINSLMGELYAETKVEQIIMSEEIYSGMKDGKTPDLAAIKRTLKQKYPDYASIVYGKFELQNYQRNKEYDKYIPAVKTFVKNNQSKINAAELSGYAFVLAIHGNDTATLQLGLKWIDIALQKDTSPNYMTTKANLLYKLGKTDDAITLQQTAINKFDQPDNKYFREYHEKILDQMKKGEKIR
ncbi:thioredoxin family protein [Chitinophaga sp. Cy-1792]|uniref:thioredoxin family protein n=1 Tax=Chitinophaga sp. Cy-1792 TaxID=2608339 RepID=UPI001420A662|nr:thioredoxin family protein [Chitinophaga sp. Cy-1792]NIG56954.1 DUF255 domain-containing protein [Chitinophaga sp. Cy-1792]